MADRTVRDGAALPVWLFGKDEDGIVTALAVNPDGSINLSADIVVPPIEIGEVQITDADGHDLDINPDGTLPVTISAPIEIDSSTPIDVNITNASTGAVEITDGVETVLVTPAGQLEVAVTAALPIGDNNIGNVDVLTLPSLPSGTNNIGDVDVLSLPVLPAGDNNIGNVDIVTLPSLPSGTNNIGDVDVLSLPSIPTGTNTIGSVKITDGVETVNVTASNQLEVFATIDDSTPIDVSISVPVVIDDSTPIDVSVVGGITLGAVEITDGVDNVAVTAASELLVFVNNPITIDDSTPINVTVNNAVTLEAADNIVGQVKITDGTEIANVTASNQLEVFAEINDTTPIDVNITNTDITVVLDEPIDVTVISALPTGDNNIGNIDVLTLPSIPAGTNNIGDVDVLTLPALSTGDNVIGRVKITDGTEVANVNTSNQLEVSVENVVDVIIDDSTPIDVNITNASVDVNISTPVEIDDSTPVDVAVTSIAAGDNNIGNVDIVTLPSLPSGTNNIGDVDVLTLPALTTGDNVIGRVKITDGTEVANVNASNQLEVAILNQPTVLINDATPVDVNITNATIDVILSEPIDVVITAALPSGTNNIGDVDVLSLPALPAGNNNIGDVDIASIAAGDNNIGNVDIVTLPSLPAGNNNIGDVDIASIAAGDNNIGNVDVLSLPSIPAGTNNIGDVDIASLPALATGDNVIGRVKITDGTEVANVNTSNQLEVSVENDITIDDSTPIDVNVTNALSSNSIVNIVQLCDDNSDTPFLLHIVYDADGTVDSTFITEIDGETPYIVIGTAVLCSSGSVASEVQITDGVENVNVTEDNELLVYVNNPSEVNITEAGQLEVFAEIDDSTPINVNAVSGSILDLFCFSVLESDRFGYTSIIAPASVTGFDVNENFYTANSTSGTITFNRPIMGFRLSYSGDTPLTSMVLTTTETGQIDFADFGLATFPSVTALTDSPIEILFNDISVGIRSLVPPVDVAQDIDGGDSVLILTENTNTLLFTFSLPVNNLQFDFINANLANNDQFDIIFHQTIHEVGTWYAYGKINSDNIVTFYDVFYGTELDPGIIPLLTRCQPLNFTTKTLCDDNGSFLRHYFSLDLVNEEVLFLDTDLEGQLYEAEGTVRECPELKITGEFCWYENQNAYLDTSFVEFEAVDATLAPEASGNGMLVNLIASPATLIFDDDDLMVLRFTVASDNTDEIILDFSADEFNLGDITFNGTIPTFPSTGNDPVYAASANGISVYVFNPDGLDLASDGSNNLILANTADGTVYVAFEKSIHNLNILINDADFADSEYLVAGLRTWYNEVGWYRAYGVVDEDSTVIYYDTELGSQLIGVTQLYSIGTCQTTKSELIAELLDIDDDSVDLYTYLDIDNKPNLILQSVSFFVVTGVADNLIMGASNLPTGYNRTFENRSVTSTMELNAYEFNSGTLGRIALSFTYYEL